MGFQENVDDFFIFDYMFILFILKLFLLFIPLVYCFSFKILIKLILFLIFRVIHIKRFINKQILFWFAFVKKRDEAKQSKANKNPFFLSLWKKDYHDFFSLLPSYFALPFFALPPLRFALPCPLGRAPKGEEERRSRK